MLKCPMCSATNEDEERKCRRCQADLALLADYVSHLVGGLNQAESLTRSGELGEAVWAYLAVLEVDPDNAAARRQVGKVVTAVRQFDETAPGRRWLSSIRKQSGWRRWLAGAHQDGVGLLTPLIVGIILIVAFYLVYSWGYQAGRQEAPRMLTIEGEEAEIKRKKAEQDKKKKADEDRDIKPEHPLGRP